MRMLLTHDLPWGKFMLHNSNGQISINRFRSIARHQISKTAYEHKRRGSPHPPDLKPTLRVGRRLRIDLKVETKGRRARAGGDEGSKPLRSSFDLKA